MALHVRWSQPYQPMTHYLDPHTGESGHWVTTKPRKIYRCHECRDWRTAKNLKIRVEYDYVEILCTDGCYGQNRRKKQGI